MRTRSSKPKMYLMKKQNNWWLLIVGGQAPRTLVQFNYFSDAIAKIHFELKGGLMSRDFERWNNEPTHQAPSTLESLMAKKERRKQLKVTLSIMFVAIVIFVVCAYFGLRSSH